jgi:4-hydroxy-4-methyl-2-oxoglutarate aldolase
MKLYRDSIVERFQDFDPATLYEAAGHRGMVDPAIRPAWAGARICGIAATVECPPGDNLALHHAVAAAQPGSVLVATTGGHLLAGAWGEILTVAARAKGVSGLAMDGAVRDIAAIAELGFPIFSRGLAIGSCTKERPGRINVPIQFGGVTVSPGDIILGDADGLVVVERGSAEAVFDAATARRRREAQIMDQLRKGKTTLELLGLPELKVD